MPVLNKHYDSDSTLTITIELFSLYSVVYHPKHENNNRRVSLNFNISVTQ